MPHVAFVLSTYPHYPRRELAETLRYELELQGVPSSLHFGPFPEPKLGVVWVLIDPAAYVAAEGGGALPDEVGLRRTIFITEERPPVVDASDRLNLLRRGGVVFVSDQTAVVALHRQGIPARLLKPGYSKSLDHFDADASRPLDVMFLAARSPRRTRYLGRAARVLSRHNCLLQISGEEWSLGDTSSFLAKSRWALLAQTKVLINLHRGEDERFEWRTALDAIHAGAVVVTEHSSGTAPLVPGEHLLVASPDSLPFVVETVLRDEQRLADIRAAAYERLSTWMPYALSVSILRAAVVELVGEPLDSPTPPPTLARPTVHVSSEPDTDPRVSALERELVQTRRELSDVHEQLYTLQDTVAASAGTGRTIEVSHETPAWAARRTPRVTVVTTLVTGAERLTATLDSLLDSRMRDFELVLVADSQTADAGRIGRQWLVDHPRLPSRLITAGSPLGLGAARNIALEFARSVYSLFLDSGQELYSRCLEVLAGTLDAMPDDITFVYPIQEVVGEADAFAEAGGDFLMSYFGWDPGRLRGGNYIHAPALIRRERLREIGGFGSDARLAGLEEYDLWCRMAERGWRGQLVSQELVRRIESGSSSVLSALNPRPGIAMDTLIARAPELMAGAVGLV